MNRMPLLTASLAILITAAFTSCKPSRVWATKDKDEKKEKKRDRDERDDRDYDDDRYSRTERYDRYDVPPPPPPPAPRYALTKLVISPTPGFTMNQSSDGRYYHRSPAGLLYWKGYDNLFFLDRSHLNRVSFSERQYQEWKRVSRR
jgi:hypothetical protein